MYQLGQVSNFDKKKILNVHSFIYLYINKYMTWYVINDQYVILIYLNAFQNIFTMFLGIICLISNDFFLF